MPVTKLKEFLDGHNVKYIVVSHSRAYTAQEIAHRARISGKELAKTVVVNVNGELAMAVLRAADHVDTSALKAATGAQTVKLATETEFQGKFPDCELGAMPPFGNIYGMAVFVEESLAAEKEIAFNACSHTELVRLSYDDFARLVSPKVLSFAFRARAATGTEDRTW